MPIILFLTVFSYYCTCCVLRHYLKTVCSNIRRSSRQLLVSQLFNHPKKTSHIFHATRSADKRNMYVKYIIDTDTCLGHLFPLALLVQRRERRPGTPEALVDNTAICNRAQSPHPEYVTVVASMGTPCAAYIVKTKP